MEAAGETSVADYRKHLDAEILIHLPTKALTFVPEDRKLPSYSDMLGAKRDKTLQDKKDAEMEENLANEKEESQSQKSKKKKKSNKREKRERKAKKASKKPAF
jgi:hypothetical protein